MPVSRKPDQILLATVGGLVAFGLVMVYSSSFITAFTDYGSSTYWVGRQALWAVLGSIAMLAAMRFDYRKLRRYSIPIMLTALALLLLVKILPESMTVVNGAARWISFGPFNIQPSEVAKFAAILYFSDWLSRRGSKIRQFVTGLLPFGIMLGLLAGLVLIQPNMSTTIILVLIGAAILFASGASLLHLGIATVLTGGVGWIAITTAGYRMQRVLVWQNPWDFPRGGGYQVIHSLYALGSGGMTGVGLGQSRQKFSWLPYPHTDAIFAVIGEELGLITCLLVLIAFVVIGIRGYRIAVQSADSFGSLIAVGVTTWLVFQALMNIAVVSTVIPFTGITLPFISYGGSSLLTTMLAAGLLLSVSRYAPQEHQEVVSYEATPPSLRNLRPSLDAAFAALRGRNWGPRLSGPGRRERPTNSDLPSNVAIGTTFSGGWRKRIRGEEQPDSKPKRPSARERVRQRRIDRG